MTQWLVNVDWLEIGRACWDTLVMVGVSLFFAVLLGLPLGIALFLTGKRQLLEQPLVYAVLSFVVNLLRSVPFVILLIVMIPVTVVLVGTSLGVPGAIPPLVVGGAPLFARLVEAALREVDRGIVEATQAIGGDGAADRLRGAAARGPAGAPRRGHRHVHHLGVVRRHAG